MTDEATLAGLTTKPDIGLPQRLLSAFLAAHPDVPGALVQLDGPQLRYACAAGVRDRATGELLQPQSSLRIASVTKTFVASATLRLVEQGRLELDDPLTRHLDGELASILGGQRCQRILLRHLLTHTSGLRDHVMDTDYLQLAHSDLQRDWTREDQVRLALQEGSDVGEPGETYHYSDTGYVILGAVIERTTGCGLAASLRSLLKFEALGLAATYLESQEPVPAGATPRAHQYVDGQDNYDANPSADLWGGGGLVAPLGDLAAFYRALFERRVFDRPETLSVMLEPAAEADGRQIGMGIAAWQVGSDLFYGHGGYWGLYAGYLPGRDVALGVAVLERAAMPALAEELLPQVVGFAPGRDQSAGLSNLPPAGHSR